MVAAMSISVPSPRMTEQRQRELLALVLKGTAELSQRLGWIATPANGVSAW